MDTQAWAMTLVKELSKVHILCALFLRLSSQYEIMDSVMGISHCDTKSSFSLMILASFFLVC